MLRSACLSTNPPYPAAFLAGMSIRFSCSRRLNGLEGMSSSTCPSQPLARKMNRRNTPRHSCSFRQTGRLEFASHIFATKLPPMLKLC